MRGCILTIGAICRVRENFTGSSAWFVVCCRGVHSQGLFCAAVDTLLFLLESKLEDAGLGKVIACADDLGATILGLRFVNILEGILLIGPGRFLDCASNPRSVFSSSSRLSLV